MVFSNDDKVKEECDTAETEWLVGLRQDAAGRALMSPDEMSLKLRQPLQCIAARSSQSRMIGGRGGDYPKKCEASGAFLCRGIVFGSKSSSTA